MTSWFSWGGAGKVSTDPERIEELLTRGVAEAIPVEELRKRLLSGERLRVKLGIDPTSPNIHLGRSAALLKLRDFQKLGHQAVFIVGDFTGIIGDTSDKESERPMLTEAQVAKNLESYFAQAGKVIDLSRAEKAYNSSWLGKLTYKEIGIQADCFSVADFISRENIKKRLDAGTRVSLREVLYPLMQGYDSVAVRADVELGGTDQRFNLLAGRTLQERYKQRPQSILMNELLPGTDGRKMSSSWGNTVNLLDAPKDMYGKVMSVEDSLVPGYFTLVTRVPMVEIEGMKAELASGTLHPKDMKKRLAREIVTLYHGKDKAEAAEKFFDTAFGEGAMPAEAPRVKAQTGALLSEVLKEAGIVQSSSELRRLIEEGAVEEIGGERISDFKYTIERPMDLRIGKRRFVRIELK